MNTYLDRFLLPLGQVPAEAAYPGAYSPALVILSIVVAVLAAFGALQLGGRVAASASPVARASWVGAGAACMGLGIWAMHFVGMLAFSLPCGISYDPWLSLFSILPGVLASAVALYVIGGNKEISFGALLTASVLLGGGIGAMHYAGMASMELPALLSYDTAMVVLSVVVAVALAMVALSVHTVPYFRALFGRWATPCSALVMGVAISGMHYTAMRAAVFFPDHEATPVDALDPTLLAVLVAFFALFVIAIAVVAGFAGRQFEMAQSMSIEVKRRRVAEQQALRDRTRLRAVFDGTADGIISAGRDGRIRHWSRAAERIFGYSETEATVLSFPDLMPDFHNLTIAQGEEEVITFGDETVGLRRDDERFPLEVSFSRSGAGDEVLVTGVLRDISERKAQEEIKHLAHHDALTRLPNRLNLTSRLTQILAMARRSQERFAVMFIDLDRFKAINDTYGHQVGDDLLCEVAERLSRAVHRETDVVARLGGDEFVVVLTGDPMIDHVERHAQLIRDSLAAPYVIGVNTLDTSPSIGVALFPEHGDDIETLIKNADTAMYAAKRAGRSNYQFFGRDLSGGDKAA